MNGRHEKVRQSIHRFIASLWQPGVLGIAGASRLGCQL